MGGGAAQFPGQPRAIQGCGRVLGGERRSDSVEQVGVALQRREQHVDAFAKDGALSISHGAPPVGDRRPWQSGGRVARGGQSPSRCVRGLRAFVAGQCAVEQAVARTSRGSSCVVHELSMPRDKAFQPPPLGMTVDITFHLRHWSRGYVSRVHSRRKLGKRERLRAREDALPNGSIEGFARRVAAREPSPCGRGLASRA